MSEETATRPPEPTSTLPLPTVTVTPIVEEIQVKDTITAVNGNLYIRRGPGLAYNPIGVLAKGESASVLARDILSDWVQISIPSQPGQTGWVSIMTGYSSMDGDVAGLPGIQVTDWPVASYLRNCTHHQMIVKPGDIIIPSLLQYPENEVWIYPGTYTVYDLDMDQYPEVAIVQLREGVEIDISLDGNGDKRKCP
ncbi:MAG: SH3 domain-containing protein [Chloroflexi bacterium]|nr:SH3 domain-containing protein [Chloroflexota bacterium]